ncbi:MAG: acyl-CoA dehydrogenase family protein [Thermodesulfobacteriota bacterium]
MDFRLNESQSLMADTAERFARQEVIPWMKNKGPVREMIARMGEVGLFGCAFPFRYGGSQAGFLAHSVVCEKIATVDSGLRAPFNLQAMTVPYTIMEWGTEPAIEKFVAELVSGRKLGCTCFSEPNAGSDLASMETKIEDKGDHFLINGSKTWISNGSIADYAIVYGTHDRGLKYKGICALVVETRQKGWQASEIDKLGDKSSPIAQVFLEDVIAPKENLLGEWGEGFKVAMTALDRGRISVGSGAVGVAQASLDASVRYANERVQFGQTIGHFQMVKALIAEMVTLVEAARLLVRRAAWQNDQGLPFTREAALAKYFAGEAAVKCAGYAMEIHGGMGYSLELPVEKYFRDSKLYQIGEGTANIMRLLIADDALGYKKANRPRLKLPSQFMDLE